MVRALLAGSKTQTRRQLRNGSWLDPKEGVIRMCSVANGVTGSQTVGCPYGVPGDRLWVREAWATHACFDHIPPRDLTARSIHYQADGQIKTGKNRPGMFMPRWASRITLEVTAVRVELLQAISEADAIAEGIDRGENFPGWYRGPLPGDSAGLQEYGRNFKIPTAFARLAYRALWESINGTGSWDANPWVWVVSFRRLIN